MDPATAALLTQMQYQQANRGMGVGAKIAVVTLFAAALVGGGVALYMYTQRRRPQPPLEKDTASETAPTPPPLMDEDTRKAAAEVASATPPTSTSSSTTPTDTLAANKVISTTTPLVSANGRFKLIQLPAGVLVLRDTVANKNLWQSKPDAKNHQQQDTTCMVTMQRDNGNLVTLSYPGDQQVWASGYDKAKDGSNARTIVQNDGNVVTQTGTDNVVVWQTNTAQAGLNQPRPISIPNPCESYCALKRNFVATERHLLPNPQPEGSRLLRRPNWPHYLLHQQ